MNIFILLTLSFSVFATCLQDVEAISGAQTIEVFSQTIDGKTVWSPDRVQVHNEIIIPQVKQQVEQVSKGIDQS